MISFSSQEDKAVAEVKLEAAKPALEEAEAALQVIYTQCNRFKIFLGNKNSCRL